MDICQGDTGDDYLDGGAGSNFLRGKQGNDTLQGNPIAFDTFQGDQGDDLILGTADGNPEGVSCGDGNDTAQAASEDSFVACEILTE